MPDQWKPGAGPGPWPAMVLVQDVDNRFARVGDGPPWIRVSHLHPMPPGITPEQQAVLDAAAKQERLGNTRFNEPGAEAAYERAIVATCAAVRAMLASQRPSDPVKEVKAAFAAFDDANKHKPAADFYAAIERLRAAIAAVEKAQKS